MIPDIESEVLTTVKTRLKADFSAIYVTSENVPVPPQFPAASIVETNSSAHTKSIDTAGIHHNDLLYTVNVYSNLSSSKKQQCKQIMLAIDDEMEKMGFIRTSREPMEMPNDDTSIYRMVARYRATVNKNKQTLRR